MVELELFLSIVAIGTGLIALWVIADVVRKLTRQTQSMVVEAQEDMVRMLAQSNRTARALELDVESLRTELKRQKDKHKEEILRLTKILAEKERPTVFYTSRKAG